MRQCASSSLSMYLPPTTLLTDCSFFLRALSLSSRQISFALCDQFQEKHQHTQNRIGYKWQSRTGSATFHHSTFLRFCSGTTRQGISSYSHVSVTMNTGCLRPWQGGSEEDTNKRAIVLSIFFSLFFIYALTLRKATKTKETNGFTLSSTSFPFVAVICGERAAYRAKAFATQLSRTRESLLRDVIEAHQ